MNRCPNSSYIEGRDIRIRPVVGIIIGRGAQEDADLVAVYVELTICIRQKIGGYCCVCTGTAGSSQHEARVVGERQRPGASRSWSIIRQPDN